MQFQIIKIPKYRNTLEFISKIIFFLHKWLFFFVFWDVYKWYQIFELFRGIPTTGRPKIFGISKWFIFKIYLLGKILKIIPSNSIIWRKDLRSIEIFGLFVVFPVLNYWINCLGTFVPIVYGIVIDCIDYWIWQGYLFGEACK